MLLERRNQTELQVIKYSANVSFILLELILLDKNKFKEHFFDWWKYPHMMNIFFRILKMFISNILENPIKVITVFWPYGIIIYHDFLPPPRRGSHVKSDNTHTMVMIYHLALIPDTWALIFSSFALFTVYPNRITQRHPSLLQMTTTRAREGGHSAKQIWPRETHSVIYVPWQGSPLFPIFLALSRSLYRHSSLSKATFTPSIQPNLGLPSTRPPLTSAINTLPAIRYSSILSTCKNHLNTLWSAVLAKSFAILMVNWKNIFIFALSVSVLK